VTAATFCARRRRRHCTARRLQSMWRLVRAGSPIVHRLPFVPVTPALVSRRRSLCTVPIVFVSGGEEVSVEAEVGKSILEVAHANDIDLEGACDGSLACSTCHVILEQEQYDALPPPEEEEEDMLDLAFGLTDTSRLGCQIKIDDSMKGMVLKVPSEL